MRTFLFILIFCSGPLVIMGQVAPPKPKTTSNPPPPPSPTVGAGNTGSAGFGLLKIPVSDDYYLGMKLTEYDSTRKLHSLSIKTAKTNYPVTTQSPAFSGSRLLTLSLSLDSSFSALPTDITESFESKLGEPDKKEALDTTWQLPDAKDPSVRVGYPVRKLNLTWNYQYHDIFLNAVLVDLRNGFFRTAYTIRYSGNEIFRTLLKNLEDREGY